MTNKSKIYFISDVHLGVDSEYSSKTRELLLINWLDEVSKDAIEINLVGDIFDFWFEYKHYVPKGFSNLFSKLNELTNKGIIINYFTGNHDMWIFDYIPEITGANLIRGTITRIINNKTIYIGHGDGLGAEGLKHKLLRKLFSSSFAQFLFKLIHPSTSYKIALAWSKHSRKKHNYTLPVDYNEECLVKFAKNVLTKKHIDFFIFGHRHIPFQFKINEDTIFTNIGDWLINFTYVVFDGENMKLLSYKNKINDLTINN